jgi:heme exporter protein A
VTQASPAPPAIETRGLSKKFGAVVALDRIDLDIMPGESVALFGPNGAGKTTLIRILALALRAGTGTIVIDGLDPRHDSLGIRQRIGLISHQSFLYDQLSATENLTFFARLYGVTDPAARALELLETIALRHRADDPVGTFSRGMLQRVSIARALVHDPPIVFLDEPFTGLDPHAAALLRSTLDGLRTRGRTVLLVTHDLRQGLELSDRWLLLSRGRVAARGASGETDPVAFERDYLRRFAGDAPGDAA